MFKFLKDKIKKAVSAFSKKVDETAEEEVIEQPVEKVIEKSKKEQKKDIIEQVSRVVSDITKKPIEAIIVKIEEVPRENMGRAGKPLG